MAQQAQASRFEARPGASQTYQMTFITNLRDLKNLETDWRELEQHCKDPFSYFQSFDWCSNWCDVFLDDAGHGDNCRLFLATIRAEGQLVAVLPMVVSRKTGVSVLQFLGTPLVQIGNMLADPKGFPPLEARKCIEALEEKAQCDAHVLSRFVASSVLGAALDSSEQMDASEETTSMLNLKRYSTVEEFFNAQGKSSRKSHRRRKKKLEALGDLQFRVIDPSDDDYETLVDQTLEMKAKWLNETGRRDKNISDPLTAQLLKALPGDAKKPSGCVLMSLELDGKTIATEIGFCHYGHYYSFIGSFDMELYSYSPGKEQISRGMAWAIENGIANYDFLGEPTAFKNDWTDTVVGLADYRNGVTTKGRLYADVWDGQTKRLVKGVFRKMPTGLRKTAVGIAKTAGI